MVALIEVAIPLLERTLEARGIAGCCSCRPRLAGDSESPLGWLRTGWDGCSIVQ